MMIGTKYPNPGSSKYSVRYSCANCGWSGAIAFTKGKRAPGTTTCPTCAVSVAKKSLPYRRVEPVTKDPVLIPIIPGAWPKNPAHPYGPHPGRFPPVKPHKSYSDIAQRQTAATKNDADRCTGFGFEFGEHSRRSAHERGVRDWEHS
ncbi:hypothetical protein LCGC14_1077660 [marine sediment metagenome]|uniref:Uncharacterized protein n=1 Tax=marine sediment metagenome TaxID=412755 RepID=A0A0F9MGB3_9ZZZZ